MSPKLLSTVRSKHLNSPIKSHLMTELMDLANIHQHKLQYTNKTFVFEGPFCLFVATLMLFFFSSGGLILSV